MRRHWLRDLLALWSHGQPVSNLGGAFNREMLRKAPGSQQTPHGELGLCLGNLPGQAVLVPQAVAQKLGCWNEEYGLYGGEDGDYGLRMQAAGLPQYYYLGPEYFENIREDEDARDTYSSRGIDKRRLHRELVIRDNLCMVNDAEAYSATRVRTAEGDASRFDALRVEHDKAPKVTEQRLYYEAIEEILSNAGEKVLMDSPAAARTLPYLTLPGLGAPASPKTLEKK